MPHPVVQAEPTDLQKAARQASLALRELLPNDPDAQMTVRMLEAALASTTAPAMTDERIAELAKFCEVGERLRVSPAGAVLPLTPRDAVHRAMDIASMLAASVGMNDRGGAQAYSDALRSHLYAYIVEARGGDSPVGNADAPKNSGASTTAVPADMVLVPRTLTNAIKVAMVECESGKFNYEEAWARLIAATTPVAPAADDERAKNEAVALMILRNDRAGAVQWAKGLVLKDGKVEAEVAPAVPAAQPQTDNPWIRWGYKTESGEVRKGAPVAPAAEDVWTSIDRFAGQACDFHGRAEVIALDDLRKILVPEAVAAFAAPVVPVEPAAPAWIDFDGRRPAVGQRCLIWSQEPWEKAPSVKQDRWDEQHEAPLSWSSATVPIGEGWDNDSACVTHWMPEPEGPVAALAALVELPRQDLGGSSLPAPAASSAPAREL